MASASFSDAKNRQGLGSGLIAVRTVGLTRRSMLSGLGAGAIVGSLMGPRLAQAATEVKFFGWQGYDTSLDAGGFLGAKGISLRPTYMTDNNEIIATARNGGIGSMDLVTPDLLYGPMMAKMGILQPLDQNRIPNLAGLFTPFKAMPGVIVDGKQYFVPFTWGNIVLMYNADVISEPPMSWLDLLKPEFTGKVGLANEMSHLAIPFALAVTGTKTPTRLTKNELEQTFGVLTRIKKEQVRAIAPTFGDLAQQFATGEITIAPAWEPVSVWAGKDAPTLKWTHPVEGSFSFVDNFALVSEAPNTDLAYELLNQALSPAAQATNANASLTAVTVADAVPLLSEEARSLYEYDDIDAAWARRGGGMPPLWPMEPEGDIATLDDVLTAWETFLQA